MAELDYTSSPQAPEGIGYLEELAFDLRNTWEHGTDDIWRRLDSELFIGRDGKVKATHAGFAGPGSGIYHTQLKDEFTSNIERLLPASCFTSSPSISPPTLPPRAPRME